MRFATFNQISHHDLLDMANGTLEDTITDMDFLETLARQRCFVVAPWIMRASRSGTMTKVTRLVYNVDGQLDKARLLLHIARELRPAGVAGRFSPRFRV